MQDEKPAPWALFWDLLRPHRLELVGGFLLLVLTSALTMVVPRLVGGSVDRLGTEAPSSIALWVLAIAATNLVRFFVRIGSRFTSLGVARRVAFSLRNRLFQKFLKLPLSYYMEQSTGDLMSRAVNDVQLVRAMTGFGLMFGLNSILSILLATIFMVQLNSKLTILVLLPLPAASFAVAYMAKKIKQYTLRGRKALGKITEQLQEDLSGITVVKGFQLEETEEKRFSEVCESYLRESLGQHKHRSILIPAMILTGGLSFLILFDAGGRDVVAGKLSIGEFTAFNLYLGFLMYPTMVIGWTISLKQRAEAALIRLQEVFSAPETIRDEAAIASHRLAGEIEIKDLSFRYPETTRPALDAVSLHARPGECVALVGKVGSGKTTVAKSLLRLIEVPEGAVFLDGRDIRGIPLADLRQSIGYVPQDDFLFSTSVSRNIGLGDLQAGQSRIRQAARTAMVEADILDFPREYETRVGERGLTVSGGQRQRISLARALLRKPTILILDDCLSAVDPETAADILDELRGETGALTCVIVAHRLQTVSHANRIYVLEAGKIVESGSHEELLERGALYRDLWEQQKLALDLTEHAQSTRRALGKELEL